MQNQLRMKSNKRFTRIYSFSPLHQITAVALHDKKKVLLFIWLKLPWSIKLSRIHLEHERAIEHITHSLDCDCENCTLNKEIKQVLSAIDWPTRLDEVKQLAGAKAGYDVYFSTQHKDRQMI